MTTVQKERKLELQRIRRATPGGRAVDRKYWQSEKGKVSCKKYAQSEKGKAVIAKRNRSESGKARAVKHSRTDKGRATQARYRLNNKEKIHARSRAYRLLPRGMCSVEGCEEQGENHHEDYNKPLEIIYFCTTHHRRGNGT